MPMPAMIATGNPMATAASQRSALSLGGKPRSPGKRLESATGRLLTPPNPHATRCTWRPPTARKIMQINQMSCGGQVIYREQRSLQDDGQ
jgi:hypothetical protein